MPDGATIFVVPPGQPPSGGDLYNRFLVRALESEGFRVDTTTPAGLATAAYPSQTEFWVDSLYIPVLEASVQFGPEDRVYFIIHSLPSLDPGIDAGEAAELRAVEDRLFARSSGFLVTGPPAADSLRERGFDKKPILVVPPAPCVLPKGTAVPPDVFTGLLVSSLIRGKGVPDFLDALGREARATDPFSVRIAGRTDIEPETASACLEAISAHPLLRERVVPLGYVPCENLGAEYERSSVLISPSSYETFGMAFHEARAFGLPVLARRAAYSEPFIESGRNGLLFDSAAEMARGMIELVRSPGRFRRLAAEAAGLRPTVTSTWTDAARSFLRQRRDYGFSV